MNPSLRAALAATALLVGSTPLLAQTNPAAQRMGVDRLRAYFPHADGRGIRVGVVADSAGQNCLGCGGNPVAFDQANGDLPTGGRVLIVSDSTSGGRDVGRAMMQQIYRIAPGVDLLAFATATGGEQAMAASINSLSTTHAVDVLCDAYSYPEEPIYQDGVIAQAVNAHTDRGLYFAAAGDRGNHSIEEVWRDDDGDDYHEFDVFPSYGSGDTEEGLARRGNVSLTIFWSEPWGRANRDLNLELFRSNGTLLASSTGDSIASRLPFDTLNVTVSGDTYLRVRGMAGSLRGTRFKIIANQWGPTGYWETLPLAQGDTLLRGDGTIVPHAGTLRAIAVGSSGYYRDELQARVSYSGAGPFRRLFAQDGSADEQVFQKPDFLAPDRDPVPNTVFASRTGFDSTAAATANLAGAAAVILQLAGGPDSMTQAQFRQFLRTKTRATPPLSHNTNSGFGFVDVLGAGLAAAGPQPITRMIIPNHLGDVDRSIELVDDRTLASLLFPCAAGDFVHTTVRSRAVPSAEYFLGDYPIPMQVAYDESASPFKAIAYATSSTNVQEETTTFESTASFQPVTPLAQLVVASEASFASNQLVTLRVDGPSFPRQTVNVEGEFFGSLSPAAPIAYYELLLPADGGPGFTVEVSSQDADIVLAAFSGRGDLLAEAFGPTLTGRMPEADLGFYLAVTSRNYATFGNYTVRVSYQRIPGLPRSTEFPAVSTEYIPNPVTGHARLFGRMGAGLDTDVWAIRTGGGPIAAAVTGAFPSTAQFGLGVYNDGQSLIAGAGPTLLPAVEVPTEAGRPYYIAAGHGEDQPATDFDVDVTVTPPPATALTLLPDREGAGYFRALSNGSLRGIGDVAPFRFVVPPLGTGSVLVAADNRDFTNLLFNPAFQLYDAQGVLVDSLVDAAGPSEGETFTYSLTPGATYYVQVFGSPSPSSYNGDPSGFGDYRVDVRAYSTAIGPEPDEPNNLVATALDITELPGVWTDTKFGAFILTDVDFFMIRLQDGQNSVQVRLRTASAKGGAPAAPAFRLVDAEGNVVGTSAPDGEEQLLTVPRGLRGTEYYVEVPGDNTGTGYALLWQGSTAPPGEIDTWVAY